VARARNLTLKVPPYFPLAFPAPPRVNSPQTLEIPENLKPESPTGESPRSVPLIELIETVTERKLPDEFNGTYEWPGGRNTLRHRFIELGPNRTRWESTCAYQFSSFLLKLIGFFCPGMFRKQNLRFLQNFKAFAEEGHNANAGKAD